MSENEIKKDSKSEGKGKIDKTKIIAALVGGVLGIIASLVVINANSDLFDREKGLKQNEMISNRQMAANELQTKVLDIYVNDIVPMLGEEGKDHMKVALLAGLHGNFSKFFDTRSVFEAFAVNVKLPQARHELKRLAKRVARYQSEFIKGTADEANVAAKVKLIWDEHSKSSEPVEVEIGTHRFKLRLTEKPFRHYNRRKSAELRRSYPSLGDNNDSLLDDVSDFVTVEIIPLDKHSENKASEFSKSNKKESNVQKSDSTDTHGHENGSSNQDSTNDESRTIELSYMDTPYMDNFGLTHGHSSGDSTKKIEHDCGEEKKQQRHRMSLRLRDIDTYGNSARNLIHEVKIELLHFKGDVYAATQRLPLN